MALFSFIKGLFYRAFERQGERETALPRTANLLFFGLGNPGEKYAATRHNIGYRIADALAERVSARAEGSFADAEYVYGTLFNTVPVLIVKPQTFMNRSGCAVNEYVRRWQLPASKTFVMVDDYNLPLGKLRARRNGSDGGHNGLKSIIECVGDDFPRLRVGIGPVLSKGPAVDFVLGTFTETEEKQLTPVIARAVEACLSFARNGIDETMNRYNG